MTPEQRAQYKQYVIAQGLTPEQADQYIQYASSQESQSAPVEQVQSPLVSTQDRLLVKNLAQSPEVGMKYLQQKNPGAQVRVQNGEIQIMSPGESSWKVVDPDTDFFSLDTLRDLPGDAGDLVYDVGSGVIQSLATAAGATGGALAGPAGAVGGGIAASGVSSAGLEALRQNLGRQMGLEQDIDLMDVGIAGGAGAISTGLLGGGKTKGLLQKGYEGLKSTVLPRVGQMMSGVPADAIRHYAGNTAKIDALEREGITPLIQEVTDRATGAARSYRDRAGKAVSEAVNSAGEKVDVTAAKNAFTSRIAALESKPDLTKADMAEIQALRSAYDRMFGLAAPKDVLNKSKEALAQEANLHGQLQNVLANPQQAASFPIRSTPVGSTYEPDYDSFLKQVGAYANEGTDDHAAILAKEAADLANISQTRQVDDILAQLKKINTPDKQTHIDNLQGADRAFDLQQRLKQLAAYEQDMTPATAAMKQSARGAYAEINKGLDDVTGRVSGEAKANYRKAIEADDFIDKNFANPDKTYRTLSGLDKKGRELVVERLKQYSDDGLLDISQEAADIQAYKYFGVPQSAKTSIPLATAGGVLGYYAGAQSGMGQGGAGVGAGVGALLGSKAGSAAMIKRLIKGGMKADDAIKAVGNMGGYAPPLPIAAPLATPAVEGMMSPWFNMSSGQP